LLFQAQIPLWSSHLQVDVLTFFNRSKFFWDNYSWKNLVLNEYQPGALLFFLIPGFFIQTKNVFNRYQEIFFCLNFLLLNVHFYLYHLQKPFWANLVLTAILFFSGPILLFRFELFTSFLVLLSCFFWKKSKPSLSFFILGMSVAVKLYPILILPYFLILSFKQKGKIFKLMFSFFSGLFLPVIICWLLGMEFSSIIFGLSFHSHKSVGLEGMPAMFITIGQKLITGSYPVYISGYGVNGLNPPLWLSLTVFNYFWVIPLICLYLFIYLKAKSTFSYEVVFLLILTFLIFSKGLNPQYIFWFLFFFPLFSDYKKISNFFIDLILVILIAFLTQLVYPILYTDFLSKFYTLGEMPQIFYIQILRNLFILLLFGRVFKKEFINS
jgi:hypothetical protein